MENIIIIVIIVVLIFIGIRSGSKHFKGEGGCCGGGSTSVPRKKKRLKKVIASKTVVIEGMMCEHCQNRVEQAINEIDGALAKVNLKKKEAVVSLEKEVDDELIQAAVEKAGYRVVEIR